MGSKCSVLFEDCSSAREGKMSKSVLCNQTKLSVVLAVPEEIEAQAIINIDVDPKNSFVRQQALKRLDRESLMSVSNDQDFDGPTLEELPAKVFRNTKYLVNLKINQEDGADKIVQAVARALTFIESQAQLVQVAISDHFLQAFKLRFDSYAEGLIGQLTRYADEKTNLKDIKLICSWKENSNLFVLNVRRQERMRTSVSSKDGDSNCDTRR